MIDSKVNFILPEQNNWNQSSLTFTVWNILYGGKGADTFKYLGGSEGIGRIKDFNGQEGDRIDISDVFADDFDPVADMISQFIKIEKQGSNAVLSVDHDGGGDSFAALAIIEGGKNLDLQQMVNQGSLVV